LIFQVFWQHLPEVVDDEDVDAEGQELEDGEIGDKVVDAVERERAEDDQGEHAHFFRLEPEPAGHEHAEQAERYEHEPYLQDDLVFDLPACDMAHDPANEQVQPVLVGDIGDRLDNARVLDEKGDNEKKRARNDLDHGQEQLIKNEHQQRG
jgi:hypothetical protein